MDSSQDFTSHEHGGDLARVVKIDPDSEFRFEISADDTAYIELIDGCCELFGAELAPNMPCRFTNCKLALFSYQGCSIRITGNISFEYLSNETPMNFYLNVHLALERLRNEAISNGNNNGPRVLLVGDGRTSVNRILLNYSVKSKRSPMWIDLDINNGSLLFPGTINALPITHMISHKDDVVLAQPISFFYGHVGDTTTYSSDSHMDNLPVFGNTFPLENTKLYKRLVLNLSKNVNQKLEHDKEMRVSGCFITYFGWSDEEASLDVLEHVIESFKVDVLLILGNEKLYSNLSRKLAKIQDLTVVKALKSGGLITKSANDKMQHMTSRIKNYFYGFNNEYYPSPVVVSFKDLHLRRIGDGPLAPISALPLGTSRKVDEIRIVCVEIDTSTAEDQIAPSALNTVYVKPSKVMNAVLGVSQADPGEEQSILEKPVIGYVYVSEIDMVKNKVTLISPFGKIPKPYLILGSIKFIDK